MQPRDFHFDTLSLEDSARPGSCTGARSDARLDDAVFSERLARHHDELRWLYMELYDNGSMFSELVDRMHQAFLNRSTVLRALDEHRLAAGAWYRAPDMVGMMLYIDNFAGTLEGVRRKLDYLERCGVRCLHLMPFLDTPSDRSRSDGGYAVSDFRRIRPDLGTMSDLEALAADCHDRGIAVAMDFVMNHTSDEHEWARRARSGEGEYMSRYFFERDEGRIAWYSACVPQVFPTTAPGHFTYLPERSQWVMTQFYPYQWDLNYANPRVFNEMMMNLLYLANRGMDVIRLDAVPYIWKKLGTNCRNLPEVHSIVRMMRMICEVVCPGVALLGEVVMEPDKVVPYFGTPERPECHMLYNVTTMASTWHTVATRDTRLLQRQMEVVAALPRSFTFLNYLRCHDDIGWGLDYPLLAREGMEEVAHKRFLNDYFLGRYPASPSRGELYNDDPATGDARFCGTCASMCGIETARATGDDVDLDRAIREHVMLHAFVYSQPGIPMLYSGDEIAQVNDWSYHDDPERADDSRYIHRGRFSWEAAALVDEPDTVEERVYDALRSLEAIRAREPAFSADAGLAMVDAGQRSLLWMVRAPSVDAQALTVDAIYNFGDAAVEVSLGAGEHWDLVRSCPVDDTIVIDAWDFAWIRRGMRARDAKRGERRP